VGVQKIYDRLVDRWGREIANEIWAKRSTQPRGGTNAGPKKKSKDMLDSWKRLPGSFESGKKR
jgi:hypothetical protein